MTRSAGRGPLPLVASLALALAACGDAQPPSSATSARPDGASEPARRLAELEARLALVEDAQAIKRLQHAFGYYLDEGLWDEAADLFAENGTIEIGQDGVYVGKARVREYLYARGGGRQGLAEGELNEHLQIMPVVSVAPDGRTAKGRWRALVMAGKLGESAFWGEGPYENEYVKEDGVWKIAKLHWFQSLFVPYEGGWQVNEDPTHGKWVSDELPPDRPPTFEYATWPSVWLPPFHFPNPARVAPPPAVPGPAEDGTVEELAARAARLAQRVTLAEDHNEIVNLQRIFGFYTDKQLWTEAAQLFADDGTIEVGGSGVYVGKARVLEYLRSLGPEGPQAGRLFDQMQLQPIVHVAPDGRTAKGRWRLFAQEAVHGEYGRWGTGVLENEYVKENGVWKIRSLHSYTTMYTPYEDGWGKTALPLSKPSEELPPDRPPSVSYQAYPAVFVAPFHYENPVTGGPVHAGSPDEHAPAPPADTAELERLLAELERRIGLLEDYERLETLNSVYGYYLAHNQWENLTALFSRDGTIEIAMRGVYAGPASVRRNLNLYGEFGIHHGLLHNHMQFQPVIHVADDGRTAKVRSRAFSIMGQYGQYAMWMGGVYENEFVKEDGLWRIKKDQVFNTYFVPYAVGFKDVTPRPPPGISESNPPDAPPTMPFEMYPRAFLPPYHYTNPVTGRPATVPGD
ncbi:MAG TPA: nuclear transport factor 2 family protein [Gammaproteobacteria bacterium]